MCGCLVYLIVGSVMFAAFYKIAMFLLKGVAAVVVFLADISGLSGVPLVLLIVFLVSLTVRMVRGIKVWYESKKKENNPNNVESLPQRVDNAGAGRNGMGSLNEGESEGSSLGDLSDEEIFERSLWELQGKSWESVGEMVADLRTKYWVGKVNRRSITISKPGGGSGTYRLHFSRFNDGLFNDGLFVITSFFLLGVLNDCNGYGNLSDYGVYSSDEDRDSSDDAAVLSGENDDSDSSDSYDIDASDSGDESFGSSDDSPDGGGDPSGGDSGYSDNGGSSGDGGD